MCIRDRPTTVPPYCNRSAFAWPKAHPCTAQCATRKCRSGRIGQQYVEGAPLEFIRVYVQRAPSLVQVYSGSVQSARYKRTLAQYNMSGTPYPSSVPR
eukprot:1770748-Rhodomonas_salina.2